jgi:integrase
MNQSNKFKITRRSVEALRFSDRSVRGTWHSDRELRGFYVVAYPGHLSFFVRYRIDGQRHTVKVGDYPAVMPEDARKAALAVLGGAARGEDEAEKRRAAREAAQGKADRMTFKTWRVEYVKDAARRLKSTRDPERYLAIAGEAWDGRPLEEIKTRDVETFRNRLANKGSTQANRWLANVRAAFAHALRLGHVEKNPAALVQLLPENAPRTRTLSVDEEKRLRETLVKWPIFERVAFTLLIDTGARLSEVLRARWDDFDLDPDDHSGTWRIPSPKAGKPQAVPILPHVGAVIAATPQLDDVPFLVPGRSDLVHRADLKGPWDALRTAAKLGADVHLHDLRRSFGLRVTRAQGIFAASKLLRHSDSRVTEKVYAPMSLEDVRGFAENTEAARVLRFAKRKKLAPKKQHQ